MPKSILIEPEKVLASGTIHFSDIPVNAYQRTIEEELAERLIDTFISMRAEEIALGLQ